MGGGVPHQHARATNAVAQPHPARSGERTCRGYQHQRARDDESEPVLTYRRPRRPEGAEHDQGRGHDVQPVNDRVTGTGPDQARPSPGTPRPANCYRRALGTPLAHRAATDPGSSVAMGVQHRPHSDQHDGVQHRQPSGVGPRYGCWLRTDSHTAPNATKTTRPRPGTARATGSPTRALPAAAPSPAAAPPHEDQDPLRPRPGWSHHRPTSHSCATLNLLTL